MAARKLQTEIDRTLKKVTEGVELFESIYDKMQACTNPTQKDKLESDLKTQIKRLQRLRDQIKTWVASNDIKDKSQLLDFRRLIETQMEKFKACEKEMKTKAFSKEGLIAAMRMDPAEKAKVEASNWLSSMVDELGRQVELSEAEIETLQNTTKRKNKGALNERQTELEHLNERRKWHASRLEIVLRLLENGSLAAETVNDLKQDVTFFVESNMEEGFEEDEAIYDELNLDAEESALGLGGDGDSSSDGDEDSDLDEPPARTSSAKENSKKSAHEDDAPPKKDEPHQSPTLTKKAPAAAQIRRKQLRVDPPETDLNAAPRQATVPTANFATQPMASAVKAGLPTVRPPAQLPPIRYAAAAAAAVAIPPTPHGSQPQPAAPAPVPPAPVPTTNGTHPAQPPASVPAADQQSSVAPSSSPSLTHPSLSNPSPMLSSLASPAPASTGQAMRSSTPPPPSGPVGSYFGSPTGSQALSDPAPQMTSSPKRTAQGAAPDSPIVQAAPFSSTLAYTGDLDSLPSAPVNGASQASVSAVNAVPSALPAPSQAPASQPNLPPAPGLPILDALSSMPPPGMQAPQFPPGVAVPQTAEQTSLLEPAIGRPQTPGMTAQAAARATAQALPSALSDLVQSFEGAKQKAAHRMNNLDQVHKALEVGYNNIPQPLDTEKPKYYVPRNPYQTPLYYPQQPIASLSTPGVFSQLDVETLFYVFYFLPGTYQQYLAAKELKKQSWRFHVKYLTWFQRHSEPQAITEEYEQGVYVYFDWEGSWCQRKKSDFRFEYRYLSED